MILSVDENNLTACTYPLMKKLYPLFFARDEITTLLKNSIETSTGIISSAFAEAAIVYFFCPCLRCCYDVSKVGGAYAPAMERCIVCSKEGFYPLLQVCENEHDSIVQLLLLVTKQWRGCKSI